MSTVRRALAMSSSIMPRTSGSAWYQGSAWPAPWQLAHDRANSGLTASTKSSLISASVASIGGASPLGKSKKKSGGREDFFFLQLSATHWGFAGPPNPQADMTLKTAVATINSVAVQPDFIVFTGDLTHTTDDGAVRRKRMSEFKQ